MVRKCVEAYAKLPERDIHLLIAHFDEVQKCRLARKSIPMLPGNLGRVARHFLNNIKCVNGTIPHSSDAALKSRNCYISKFNQFGPPKFWITANPNSVENPIVIHRITGEVYIFDDIGFVQKSNLIAGNP